MQCYYWRVQHNPKLRSQLGVTRSCADWPAVKRRPINVPPPWLDHIRPSPAKTVSLSMNNNRDANFVLILYCRLSWGSAIRLLRSSRSQHAVRYIISFVLPSLLACLLPSLSPSSLQGQSLSPLIQPVYLHSAAFVACFSASNTLSPLQSFSGHSL